MVQEGKGLRHIRESLPRSGQPTSNAGGLSGISPKCKICLDIGWVHPAPNGQVDYARTVPCICRLIQIKERQRARLLKFCELPAGSENLTLETFRPGNYPDLKQAYRWASALAEGSEKIKWLTLSGGVDTGKTHLAIAVCRHWLSRDIPAKFVFVPLLLDWLRESFEREKLGETGLTLSARMKMLSEVPLLVLDDLGVQRPTPWAMERLMTIIDYRYENHLALMVTTNKALEDLPGDDEGRIASRLKRFIPGRVLVLEAPEYIIRRDR